MSRIAWLVVLLVSASSLGEVRTYVAIVGNNTSVEAGVQPLKYADDDAARYYELFRPIATRVALLSVLDGETQRLFRPLPPLALEPTHKNLKAVLSGFNSAMARDKEQGHEPVLYLIYVGHGHLGAAGQGYVSLLDGPFTGEDLWRGVIARSEARFNHLIFDACNSFLLVARRGGEDDDSGPDATLAIRSYVEERSSARFPNTGMIMSTSTAKETHEWSVFRSGVFSHEVRSALSGAADVNGDGRVEYSELEAFLSAANLAVDDPRARLEAFVSPPALDRHRPLVDLGEARFDHFLKVPAAFSGRFHLEDGRGVRYLDANKTSEAAVYIALVDAPFYFVRTAGAEARVPLDVRGTVDLGGLDFLESTQVARGSVAEAFRDLLFQVPYGPGFYQGFIAKTSGSAARKAGRPFPPPGFEPRAMNQPLKNPYE
ncbi:MAG: hypothetical protein ACYC8T_25110 [Myxococcaceae bacterium]